MHVPRLPLAILLAGLVAPFSWLERPGHAEPPRVLRHVPIFAEAGRFGGWPANHGIWIWDHEILVGFSIGWYKDLGPERHHIDRQRPEEHVLARSRDGGESWRLEFPAAKGMLIGSAGMRHGTLPDGPKDPEPIECPGGIDFTHPDFAMTVRMADIHKGVSRFYVSTDRGKTWSPPYRLPLFEQPGIAARTDYLVNGKHDCLLFLTASKRNEREGRPLCVRTTDGGKSWRFVSFIGPEPAGYAIMPSTVRLSPNRLLTTIRCLESGKSWIDAYLSEDDGESWTYLNRPVPDTGVGNPPALIRLRDGRLCLTYGRRATPFGMYARLSRDEGRSWSDAIALRENGGNRDIGYPRSVQRPDGQIVTVYYFNTPTNPYRFIAATLWDPGKP